MLYKNDKEKAKMIENPTKGKKNLPESVIYKYIMREFEADREAMKRRGLADDWKAQEKMYNNDWWEDGSRPEHLSFGTNNALFEVIETTLPVVTSKPPKPDVKYQPTSTALDKYLKALESDPAGAEEAWQKEKKFMYRYAQGLRRELMKIWYRTMMPAKVKQTYREYGIKGTGILRSVWSKSRKMILNEVVDIRTCIPHRHAENIQACEQLHFSHAYYKPASWVAKKYGIPVKEVHTDGYLDAEGEFRLIDTRNDEMPAGAVSGATENEKAHPDESKKSEKLTLVIDFYCKGSLDIDEEDMEGYFVDQFDEQGIHPQLDKDGNQVQKYYQRKKWENGRVITIARGAKGKVLRDEARPYKRIPFFRVANYERAGDFWGSPEGRQIEEQVRMMNMIMSNINDNARLTGNPQKEIVIGSEVKTPTNMPGKTYRSLIPNGIRNLNPPSMPAYIRMFFLDLQNMVDRITGITDAFRGIAKSGDSGVKVRSLIDQGVGRLQPKTLAFTELSRELYEHWADIISKFYPEKIVQKLDDKDGEARYEVFNPKDVPEAVFDIDVSLTAMLPTDDLAEFEEAMALLKVGFEVFQMPLLSPQHLVELAPTLEDKQRAKDWIDSLQKQMKEQAQGQDQYTPEKLKELGLSDDEIVAFQKAQQAGDVQAIKGILGKYIPDGATEEGAQ